jgi:hypothetical protein
MLAKLPNPSCGPCHPDPHNCIALSATARPSAAMATPWRRDDTATTSPCLWYGSATTEQLQCHGAVIALVWQAQWQ